MGILSMVECFWGGVTIAPVDAKKMIHDSPRSVVIDVRSPQEYDEGHLEEAVLIPDFKITEDIDSVVPNKATPVFVYGCGGKRAGASARQLRSLGYINVYNIGGILYPGFTDVFLLVKSRIEDSEAEK